MNPVHTILKWADAVGLTLQYPTLRRPLFDGIHTGYVSSLATYSIPMDQLFADVQALHRQGPIVDGVVPFRVWLQNVVAWAKRAGQPVDALQPILESNGLTEPTPAKPASQAPVSPAGSALSVLFLAANLDRTRLLNIDQELNDVQSLVGATVHRDRFQLSAWPHVKMTQVAPLLIRKSPRVLHFSGHGGADGALQMLNDDGKALNVPAEHLSTIVSMVGDSLQLIVLNACYSTVLADALVEKLDVAVIGMGRMVQDATALLYARTLYQALFDGLPVRKAHGLAAVTLFGMGQVDANAPQLRERAGSTVADRRLWD